MAYGGKHNVTKQVVIYVKKNQHMSNRQLDINVRRLFGYTYADSTYDRIKRGEYDRKFFADTNSDSFQYENRDDDWDDNNFEPYYEEDVYPAHSSDIKKSVTQQKTNHSGTSKKLSGGNYFAAFCLGGLGIYGLFHGATPMDNPGAFVIAVLLIGAGISCLSGKRDE